jgi:fructokinase
MQAIGAMTARLLASIELGGTKTIVAVAHDPLAPLAIERFPTTDGAETMARVVETLRTLAGRHGPIAGIGIAAFGPLRLDRGATDWGTVLTTPMPGWSGTSLASTISQALAAPIEIDTDVNAAALSERAWGVARGCDDLAYLTIGTGVGGGLVLGGVPRHGILHPELGHIRVARYKNDGFAGICPIHGDCLEGLVSGPAIEARLGKPLDHFPEHHPFRKVLSHHIAQACLNLTLIVMPAGVAPCRVELQACNR